MRLKSLFFATLLSLICVLAFSFVVFRAISNRMQRLTIDPTFNRFDQLQLDSAREEYERHGKQALADYMGRLNHTFVGSHYLLDSNGIDVLTGDNRSDLLPPPPANPPHPALLQTSSVEHTFVIEALAPGRSEVRFMLRRPWEKNVPPVRTLSVRVTVISGR